MNNYIFQTGGEDDSSFFNQYVDTFIGMGQNNEDDDEATTDYTEQSDVEEATDDENDFMKQLADYDDESGKEEDIKMLERFNNELYRLQGELDSKIEELQQQMILNEALATDEGQDYLNRMYDVNDDSVPYTLNLNLPNIYNNSAS